MRDGSVRGYLGRLERRVWLVHAVRGAAAAVGIGLLSFAGIAAAAGPVVGAAWAVAAWLIVAAAAVAGAWHAGRPALALRGARAARLLGPVRAELASAARSAAELEDDPTARKLAPSLVDAHAAQVREALADVPVGRVLPWRAVRHPVLAVAAAAAAVALALLLLVDRAGAGAWALTHPGVRDEDGVAIADVVATSRAQLVYPAYLGREAVTLEDPVLIEAPRGTSVTYTVRARVAGTSAVLRVAGAEVRLPRRADGSFAGRFVVRESGPLRVRIETAGGWLAEATGRAVRAIPDQVPRVSLLAPAEDATIDVHDPVEVTYDAADDVGIRSIDLVIRAPDGREVRRALERFDVGIGEPRAGGGSTVVASELGGEPGDRITLFVEATDGDLVAGPNVGRSAERTLVVASEASRRAERIGDLARVLDEGLAALADRLEEPVPEDAAAAERRGERAGESSLRFAESLVALAEVASGGEVRDPSVYRSMAHRVRRKVRAESSASTHARQVTADAEVVEELERDVLLLADLLGRARLEDAAAIARDLERLRRQMASLLAELRRTDSPEARRQLLAALARAEQRLRDLMARLAQMGEDVPSDFFNRESLKGGAPDPEALAALRQALEEGDLDAAARHLLDFERRLHSLAQALGSAEESFAEARFGPRERALAEALDALAGLESEQRGLAERSGETRRQAAERAIRAAGGREGEALQRLARRAAEARAQLDRVPGDDLDTFEQEALDRARQRLRDTEDALRTEDLGEARRMSDEAARDVEGLARDLELSSLMFPGHRGEVSEGARAARRASHRLLELRDAIDHAIPRIRDYVDEPGRRQMRQDNERQGEASGAAERLAGQLRDGPDGTPLSPEGERGVLEARESMERARDALRRGDPIDASSAQEEAARRLTEVREQLEQSRRDQTEGGGGGGGEAGDGSLDFRRRVEIPDADAYHGPMEMRRRLLDAMREGAPHGYEDPVRRYYEDLLR